MQKEAEPTTATAPCREQNRSNLDDQHRNTGMCSKCETSCNVLQKRCYLPTLQSQMIQFGCDVLRDGAVKWLSWSEPDPNAFLSENFAIHTSCVQSLTNMCATISTTTTFTIHDQSAVRFGRVSCHLENMSCNPDRAEFGTSAVDTSWVLLLRERTELEVREAMLASTTVTLCAAA